MIQANGNSNISSSMGPFGSPKRDPGLFPGQVARVETEAQAKTRHHLEAHAAARSNLPSSFPRGDLSPLLDSWRRRTEFSLSRDSRVTAAPLHPLPV
jgi:hypothetical protein